MKKHRVIIDMTNNSLVFWPGYYIHIGTIFLLSSPSFPMEIAAVKIEEDISSQKMIKKNLKKDMTDFL